ncbi:hypothetical protein E3O55_00400 [Cryobacterium sp. MDB1-18-2]|uniref:RICIN domain-containing protein n=1 Tax=unclassified Cryobacterium TaxID=2649013 RepID=UPI0010690D85|nr:MULTISPECIES: RICIN domain-containing protein [unclassified Cryobacterium]TFC35935.1 hypothetical protein E3O55_00400 [Cryobacterium sp. MDB1-18-2]TFC41555.1 hypothetical protein E3O50_10845 [Cryobacterium sp. MDB1-18-1]
MIKLVSNEWSQVRELASKRRDDESGVALLTAIFFMILAAGLSVVLLSSILSQAVPAITAARNTRTVYSAQAGLQTTLALIRTAAAAPVVGTTTFGVPAKLPCAASGVSVLSGSVAGSVTAGSPGASYAVTVDYFAVDPADPAFPAHDTAAWRSANRMTCALLASGTPAGVPNYAYILSRGTDDAAPTTNFRTLSAVYKFKVTNINVSGGLIYDSTQLLCLQAETATAGSKVKFVAKATCTGTPLQLWAYTSDYRLKLASTTAGGVPGECITGPVTYGAGTQNALLADCVASTLTSRWNQLWSWTGSYSWVGQQNPIVATLSSNCLAPDGTSTYLQVRNGCGARFAPTSSVGAGAASYATHQLVNYLEFGRCADVTNQVISSAFMIAYPCKQDPSGLGTVFWNHKWFYNEPPSGSTTAAPQPIVVHVNDSAAAVDTYCLTTPSAAGVRVTFTSCSGAANQKWVRYNDTGDYASSYVFKDSLNRCLLVNTGAVYTLDIHEIQVGACDGSSLAQKWNAPADFLDSTLGGYREIAG